MRRRAGELNVLYPSDDHCSSILFLLFVGTCHPHFFQELTMHTLYLSEKRALVTMVRTSQPRPGVTKAYSLARAHRLSNLARHQSSQANMIFRPRAPGLDRPLLNTWSLHSNQIDLTTRITTESKACLLGLAILFHAIHSVKDHWHTRWLSKAKCLIWVCTFTLSSKLKNVGNHCIVKAHQLGTVTCNTRRQYNIYSFFHLYLLPRKIKIRTLCESQSEF
jgi:hypothetical protein